MMSAQIRADDGTILHGNPEVVFEQTFDVVAQSYVGRSYDVSPDGKRFLIVKEGASPEQRLSPPQLVIVEHWFDELKQRVPVP